MMKTSAPTGFALRARDCTIVPLLTMTSLPFRQNSLFVAFDFVEPRGADGDVSLTGSSSPTRRRTGSVFSFFQHRQPGGEIAGVLQLPQACRSVPAAPTSSALHRVARADHPGGDAVDAGVEVVEADVRAVEIIAADQLLARWPAARR